MVDFKETKQGKNELKKLSKMAYEEDLRRSLLPVSIQFDKWKRGTVNSFEVAEVIHEFYTGPARKLYQTYNYDDQLAVASGIAKGLIDRATVSKELLESLSRQIQYLSE